MASKPQRIQLSRRKGWRMPPNTVKVSRPSAFGNPWIVGNPGAVMMDGTRIRIGFDLTAHGAVLRFKAWLNGEFGATAGSYESPQWGFVMVPPGRAEIMKNLTGLRGKNLACWCKPGEPCHADVLLELANS